MLFWQRQEKSGQRHDSSGHKKYQSSIFPIKVYFHLYDMSYIMSFKKRSYLPDAGKQEQENR